MHNWLSRSWRVALLLSLFNSLLSPLTPHLSPLTSTRAQNVTDGEAFYIYRNDGDFDGFFFDQVQEMRYSKIDLNGVERDDYVVQEVVTPDSIYRIPLAAIDSVGFVQPEIKFNKKVRHMDQLGMTPYVTAVNGMRLTFDASVPAALRPKVGDMLLGFTGVLEENGFGGRVTAVTTQGGNLIVDCVKPEQLSDIFEQFITIEQVGVDEQTQQQQRRLAGYNQMRAALRGHPETTGEAGGGSLSLVNINTNLRVPIIPDNLFSEDGTFQMFANIEANLNLKVELCMVYQIDSKNFFAKAMLSEDFGVQAGFDMGVKGSYTKSLLPFNPFAIKFPVACPLFEIRPVPDLVAKLDGSLSIGFRFPRIGNTWRQTFVIDIDKPDYISYQGNEKDSPSNFPSLKELFTKTNGQAGYNGSVQLGLRIQAGIFTNGWFSWLFDAGMGMNIYAGPKLEGRLMLEGNWEESGDGAYQLRNNRIALNLFSVDYEAFGYMTLDKRTAKYTFADGSFQLINPLEAYQYPTLELKKGEYDKETQLVKARLETDQRIVFASSEIGIALLDKDMENIVTTAYHPTALSFGQYAPPSFETTFSGRSYKPGRYYVTPLLKEPGLFGGNKEYPVRSLGKSIAITPYLDVPATVGVNDKGGTVTIPCSTNGTLEVTSAGGVSTRVVDNSTVAVDIAPNESSDSRDFTIYVTATADDVESTRKTVKLTQAGTSDRAKYISISGMFEAPYFMIYNADATEDGVHYTGTLPCQFAGDDNSYYVSGSYTSTHAVKGQDFITQSLILDASTEGGAPTINETISWSFNFSVADEKMSGSGRSKITATCNTPDWSTRAERSIDFTISEGVGYATGGYGTTDSCTTTEYWKSSSDETPYTNENHENLGVNFSLYKTFPQ